MNNCKKVKTACYLTNISMAAVANLSPLLFMTFRELYGISYSLLGLLVLANFSAQFLTDLLFSIFSEKINTSAAIKVMPIMAAVGLLLYAGIPHLFPDTAYLGLLLGTITFSIGAGLSEVLISPIIAALPADNPDSEMSKLHSVYAWGVVGVILFASAFLYIFERSNWYILALLFSLIPMLCGIMFFTSDIPSLKQSKEKKSHPIKYSRVFLLVFAIFLGGACELTMAQWSSSYLEAALGIPKALGDIFGVALFAAFMGIGRTLYTKIGKCPERALLLGGIGALACYIITIVSPFAVLSLFSCALCGLSVSMLWPGSLIIAEERIPCGGVFIFAAMAGGGDLGASVAPQLMGIVTDMISSSDFASSLASSLGMSIDSFAMRGGMLISLIFPLMAVIVYAYLYKTRNKQKNPL